MQGALQPVNAAVWGSLRQVASFVSNQPDLKFQIPQGASSWLLNTYLDKVTILACCQTYVQEGSGLGHFAEHTLFPVRAQLNRCLGLPFAMLEPCRPMACCFKEMPFRSSSSS